VGRNQSRSERTQTRDFLDLARTVFNDPRLVSMADLEHSETEERWFSVGCASNGMMLSSRLPLVGRRGCREHDPYDLSPKSGKY
jgi:uncharacterized DUF497 family protein